MVNATIEIDTTRDIAHQIVRHRSFAFQEFSQRYADPKEQGEMFDIAKHVYKTLRTDRTQLTLTWPMKVWLSLG